MFVMFKGGAVMPLYSGGVQGGGMVEGTFPAPIREHRFPNSVWHQTSAPDNTIGNTNLVYIAPT
jgi:hypothetical protein